MLYPAAIEFLYTLRLFGANFGLENTRRLAAFFGNPQRKLRFIHVAGTNGKGSACAMIESIYSTARYRVGLFTSPHLVLFRERFQVNRQMISEARTVELVEDMQRALRNFAPSAHPTFFEVVTVMALRYFAQSACDLVVWETGLGGRLDATNIVTPIACLITNIQLDHEKWLGHSRAQIAREKAGIIKPGVPLLTTETSERILSILRARSRQLNAPFQQVTLKERRQSVLRALALPLPGRHQKLNAALAIATVDLLSRRFKVRRADLEEGLRRVHWPGRLQIIPNGAGRQLILDGAHNPAAARALRSALAKLFPEAPLTLILGIFRDKNWRSVCRILAPLARRIVAVEVKSPRAVPILELANFCKKINPQALVRGARSIERALGWTRRDKHTLITGSLYLIGEALSALGPGRQNAIELRLNEWTGEAEPGLIMTSRSNLAAKIVGITFDVAGTLIEPCPSVGHIYGEMAREYGWSALPPAELTKRFQHAWKRKRLFDYSNESWKRLVAETFDRDIPNDFFARLYARFERADSWRIYAEVPAVLAALQKKGLALGIVSNWDLRLRPLLTALELIGFFQVVIISGEVGSQKPDRRIFDTASYQLGIAPGGLLHIGDQENEDLAGAARAGWSALKLTRRGAKRRSELSQLTELLELLQIS